jgi:flavin reductase (DIM6/NTAB) family NADH-FMN oxidoreductase RutF
MPQPGLFDTLELRSALGTFATGVTVISIIDAEGKTQGMTVNSFTSVSLEPPLILWSLALNTPNFEPFHQAERFAVNVLAADQVAISERFASLLPDKFAGLNFSAGLGRLTAA